MNTSEHKEMVQYNGEYCRKCRLMKKAIVSTGYVSDYGEFHIMSSFSPDYRNTPNSKHAAYKIVEQYNGGSYDSLLTCIFKTKFLLASDAREMLPEKKEDRIKDFAKFLQEHVLGVFPDDKCPYKTEMLMSEWNEKA